MRACFLLLIGIGSALLASDAPDFWNTKAATAWTQQEAEDMMAHSPWAKQRPMPGSQRPSVSYVETDPAASPSTPPAAQLGNITNQNSPLVATGRAPSLATAPIGSPQPQPPLRIVWASALPVRLAAMKLHLGPQQPTEDDLAKAHKESHNYVIAVVGLPAPDAPAQAKALAANAFLSVPGKPAVIAVDSEYRRIGSADVYFFRFARSEFPISLADKEAEFRLKTGGFKLSQKFELSSMLFEGSLAL